MNRRWSFALLLMFVVPLIAACTPTIKGSGPVRVPPALLDDAYRAMDGTELALQTYLPDGPKKPRAVLVALHGYGDYANGFDEIGTYLSAHDFALYSFDQRGFGRSPSRGFWAGHPVMAEDARAMVRLAKARHGDVPVYLIGMSMGGAVAMLATAGLTEDELAGTILAAPAVWGRETMPWAQSALLWTVSHSLPALPLTGRGLKRQPTDNIDLLRRLSRDPHMLRVSRTDMIHGLVDLMDAALVVAPGLEHRLLVLTAGRDEIVPSHPQVLMRSRLPDVPDGMHQFINYESGYHMLLRGLEAEQVWSDIRLWITASGN